MLATPLRAHPAARLLLRALEERAVPAVFAVTTVFDSGAGSFRDALSQIVDGREDRIVFDESLAGQTVNIDPVNGVRTPEGDGFLSGFAKGFDIRTGVTIVGPDAAPITLNVRYPLFRSNSTPVLDIRTDQRINLSNLRITGGDGVQGGGIRNEGSVLTLTHCVVEGNRAEAGGGIYKNTGRLTIFDSTIRNNRAEVRSASGENFLALGGGILAAFAPTNIIDSSVVGNVASVTTFDEGRYVFAGGGGIDAGAALVLENVTVADNVAEAIGSVRGTASAVGGGVFAGGLFSASDSRFTNNRAESKPFEGIAGADGVFRVGGLRAQALGGAIYAGGDKFNLTGSLLNLNSAVVRYTDTTSEGFVVPASDARGGALFLQSMTSYLFDDRFNSNGAEERSLVSSDEGNGRSSQLSGGAIFVDGSSSATLELNRFTVNELTVLNEVRLPSLAGATLATGVNTRVYLQDTSIFFSAIRLAGRVEGFSALLGTVRSKGGNFITGFDPDFGTIVRETGIDEISFV